LRTNLAKGRREMPFITVMKDKSWEEEKRNVLHEGDERQIERGGEEECPS
jgi:hypothetical protein